MNISIHAGKLADASILIDVGQLVAAYYKGRPDPSLAFEKRVWREDEADFWRPL